MPLSPNDLLNPAELASLRGLGVGARRAAAGHFAGRHASRQRGRSIEFLDYRPFAPGDPPADVDWKVFGRSDKLFVRRYEHQSDLTVRLVVDASASMAFAGIDAVSRPTWLQRLRGLPPTVDPAAHSKYAFAARLAAGLGLLVIQQQDRVGLTIARADRPITGPTRSTYPHLRGLVRTLAEAEASGTAELAAALHRLAERATKRGLVVVLSDLLEPERPVVEAVARFRHAGHEAVVIHTLHPDEWSLPELGPAVLIDSEDGRRVRLDARGIRDTYRQRMTAQSERWQRSLSAIGVAYHRVTTDQPVAECLRRWLIRQNSV